MQKLMPPAIQLGTWGRDWIRFITKNCNSLCLCSPRSQSPLKEFPYHYSHFTRGKTDTEELNDCTCKPKSCDPTAFELVRYQSIRTRVTDPWMHVAPASLHVPLSQHLMIFCSHLQGLPKIKSYSPTMRLVFGSVQSKFSIKLPSHRAFSSHTCRAEGTEEPPLPGSFQKTTTGSTASSDANADPGNSYPFTWVCVWGQDIQ